MKTIHPCFAAGWLAAAIVGSAQVPDPGREPVVLAQVELAGPPPSFGLPVHAILQDAAGRDYLLVLSTEAELHRAGWPYRVLDPRATAPEDYLIATARHPAARDSAAARRRVILDDGVRCILRANADEAEALAVVGFALERLTPEPILWSQPPDAAGEQTAAIGPLPDPVVETIMARTQTTNLFWFMRQLTGEEVILSGGEPGVISTRHTSSGLSVSRAAQFADERFRALGLEVRFHRWTASGYSNRNVIATQKGSVRSNEYVLLTAHLDNQPSGPRAPGADDNASGCAAVLMAASLFSQQTFDRSIRFVLFTGEEQGLLGSAQYAAAARSAGDNIIAVLNLDMISWNWRGAPVLRIDTRPPTNPGYPGDRAIASLFTNVVGAYGLGGKLSPVIMPYGGGGSDHVSFWNRAYPAALVIEDYQGDFNAFYHTTNDSTAWLNWEYFSAITRATIGTAAHLALPLASAPRDVIQVALSNGQPNSGVGGGTFCAKLFSDPVGPPPGEGNIPWSNAPAPTLAKWLKPFTEAGGQPLQTEARCHTNESRFLVNLGVVVTNDSLLSTSNRLQIDLLSPPYEDRDYLARITLNPLYTAGGFICQTNLRALVRGGGQVVMPNLTNVSNGVVYGQCELVVRTVTLPLVLAPPQDAMVMISSQAVFSVEAIGRQPLQFQWSFNGSALPDATNQILTVSNVTPSNAGAYAVTVSNAFGLVTSQPGMLIPLPLVITAQPTQQLVRPGSNATFSVTVTSSVPVTCQWFFDGVLLEGATQSALTVTNVQFAHEGNYSVAVSNRYGSVRSRNAPLFVLINPLITVPPVSQSVVVGGSATFSVAFTGNPQPFGVEWRFGSRQIASNTVYDTQAFFVLTNAQPIDAGTWRVVVRNVARNVPVGENRPFTLAILSDNDGDGLPDAWETDCGINQSSPNHATSDDDGDGLTNGQEYTAGSEPTNALSYLKVDTITLTNAEAVAVLRFGAMSNKTYTVQHREGVNPGAWQRLTDVLAMSSNRVVEIVDDGVRTNRQRVYRLVTPRMR